MIRIRRAEERGHFDHGWLDTFHTFSFADYYDPEHMGFRALRVINDDRVAPGHGFPTHPHRDMEIITYVLDGALAHRDSMGNGSTIRPGEVQRMSAGTGVRHSEENPLADTELHLLQIWILPERAGITPGYEQKAFSDDERRGTLRLVASHDGRDGSVTIHQDAELYASLLDDGQSVTHEFRPDRHGWLHVARGEATVNGIALKDGDGVAISDEKSVTITGRGAEILLFDLN
ncbi:MAG TPA: pirin family protein [Vicinamibacterales bacterium]|jgi:redox-sensitive bicupin YhaK (pirin superfamily)